MQFVSSLLVFLVATFACAQDIEQTPSYFASEVQHTFSHLEVQDNDNQTTTIVEVSEDFYNFRGEFYLANLINIGAQTSLVRLGSGKFVLLDCLVLDDAGNAKVDNLTNNGTLLQAIINVHPFHTVFVPAVVKRYPNALLYGTARHHQLYPDLDWQPELTESAQFQKLYAADFSFSVPKGVDFISANPDVHFSSVLVYHNASNTVHVDDTYIYFDLPSLVKLFHVDPEQVAFHPALALALQKRSGASQDFRDWANGIAEDWAATENLCAAHATYLLGKDNDGDSFHDRFLHALAEVEWILKMHDILYPSLTQNFV